MQTSSTEMPFTEAAKYTTARSNASGAEHVGEPPALKVLVVRPRRTLAAQPLKVDRVAFGGEAPISFEDP
jgi:hypothetical protein